MKPAMRVAFVVSATVYGILSSASMPLPALQRPAAAPPAGILGPPRGMAVFQSNCANCHAAQGVELGGRVAPALSALNAMPPERIYEALATGKMKDQAAALNDRQKRDVAEFLAGRLIVETDGIKKMTNPCASNPPLTAGIASTPSWNGWSAAPNNARFQTTEAAGLNESDIPRLKL